MFRIDMSDKYPELEPSGRSANPNWRPPECPCTFEHRNSCTHPYNPFPGEGYPRRPVDVCSFPYYPSPPPSPTAVATVSNKIEVTPIM